jgi:uncharacterized Zn finger protein
MFSFMRFVLENTEKDVYYLGLQIANEKKVVLNRVRNNGCTATITGGNKYSVDLGFTRIGVPYFDCICRYYCEQQHLACKHIVAAALTYDRKRGVPDPNDATVKNDCTTDISSPTEKHICRLCNYFHIA